MRSVKALEQQHGWPVNGVISKKDAQADQQAAREAPGERQLLRRRLRARRPHLSARKAGTARVKVLDASGNRRPAPWR